MFFFFLRSWDDFCSFFPGFFLGHDVLAKAKTGTGKTLSFLLPAVEGIARTPRQQRRGLSALIISPTRELAQQIADEANQVLVRDDRRRRQIERKKTDG